jgi:pilin/secretion family protein with methylation motif
MMSARATEMGRRLLQRLRGERGFSIAEAMIAMLILAIGALAVLNLITAAAHNSFRGEQSQVVNDRLQQEMEKIVQLPYDQIALTGVPADSSDTTSPAWRVQGNSYSITQNGTQPQPLVYNGSTLYTGGSICDSTHPCGAVDPAPTHFTSGDVGGTIYRYVVWRNDPSCPDVTCPGSQDLKRVIVAIKLDNTPAGGSNRHYQELFKEVSNPATNPVTDPNPGPSCTGGSDCVNGICTGTDCVGGAQCTTGSDCAGGVCTGPDCSNDAVPWTFWLTDTTCDNAARQPVSGDHLVHNANGACSAGLKDSSNCSTALGITSCPAGAPDLMVTAAPPLAGETPLYDYATDIEPPTNGSSDKGLQMPPPSSTGCLSSLFQPLENSQGAQLPDPDSARMQTIHKWVSPPMGTGFNVTLLGNGTLDLWTQSINAAAYSGKICIWLFERHLNAQGAPVDTPATNLTTNQNYFTYTAGTWPTGWTELHIPFRFSLNALGPNSRLGLAIQVEKSGTSGGGMQFLYDEPSFDSRLEVTTQSVLPF